jgi:Protein of unknown function (DUF3551)
MRIIAAAVLALAATTLANAPASAAQDRYCVQGRNAGYPGNCAFSTYAQCQATASGPSDGCGINPRYAYSRQGGYGYGDGYPRQNRGYW